MVKGEHAIGRRRKSADGHFRHEQPTRHVVAEVFLSSAIAHQPPRRMTGMTFVEERVGELMSDAKPLSMASHIYAQLWGNAPPAAAGFWIDNDQERVVLVRGIEHSLKTPAGTPEPSPANLDRARPT
jgi:hypothetical protein